MPLISVMLPTFARKALLTCAIASVQSQTHQDWELLIADDGSSDGSAEIIAQFAAKDARIKHIRFEKNVGLPALTTAEAFARSTGEFIAWQFDDCVWEPDHLSVLLAALTKNEHAGVAYGKVKVETGSEARYLGIPFDRKELQNRNFIPNVSTLIRRTVYETLGWVDPSVLLKRINDHDMWIRAADAYEIVFCDYVTATESGVSLGDSLGNSVTLLDGMASKYMKSDRAGYLKTENRGSWSPFLPPEWLSDTERNAFLMLCMEHFVRTSDYYSACATFRHQMPELANSGDQEILGWYIRALGQEKLAAHRYAHEIIQQQRAYIDAQSVYISERDAEISELRSHHNFRPSLIKRIIRRLNRSVTPN